MRQTLLQAGMPAQHQQGLGNSGILDRCCQWGVGPGRHSEYTGTIVRDNPSSATPLAAPSPRWRTNEWLAPRGLKVAVPLGFNNTYALALRESVADRLGLQTLSDLARLPAGALSLGPVA